MKKWIIILVIAAVVLVGGFFAYRQVSGRQQAASAEAFETVRAERGSLTATVGATGIVRSNQSATLNWQTSGTVGAVNFAAGEPVTAGEVLAELERTSLAQNVILAQADLVTAQKALNDLMNSDLLRSEALKAVEEARKALEDGQNPELSQAQAAKAVADAQKAVEDAENALRWSQTPADQTSIDEAEAQVTIARDELEKAQEKYEPYAGKSEDNLTRARLKAELAAAQQRYDAAVRKLNSLQGTASELVQAQRAADLETARAQLLQAQRDYERVKDGADPADIALLEAQLADAQREYERVKDGPPPEDIEAARARVAAAQATLDQARLTAPFDGTVTDVISKAGDQVTAGTPGFRIDDLSHLLIDVQVSEVDVNKIRTGQDVTLVFDAIPGKEYQGVVTAVDPVGTSNQGIVDFTVTVELIDADDQVKTGMTAAVNIVVNVLDDVLLVPNRAVRILEGERVVYVLRDGTFEPVEITLGSSSESVSEVLTGDIQVGDSIILNPPAVFDQNGPPPFVQRGG